MPQTHVKLIDADDCGRYVAGKIGIFRQVDAATVMEYMADYTDANTVAAIPVAEYNALKTKYKKLLETAGILDAALREYQQKYGE